MKIDITTEEIIDLASKSKDLRDFLESKFPNCFEDLGNKTDDVGKDSLPIKKGDLCYLVHGTPERYTITKAKFPNCSSGAVRIFRGDALGRINANLYVIKNTKRFTLEDIDFALNYCHLEDHYGSIVSRLNDKNHPDTVLHYNEDMLNANNL